MNLSIQGFFYFYRLNKENHALLSDFVLIEKADTNSDEAEYEVSHRTANKMDITQLVVGATSYTSFHHQ